MGITIQTFESMFAVVILCNYLRREILGHESHAVWSNFTRRSSGEEDEELYDDILASYQIRKSS